jgi:hypothetical protein
MKNVALYVTVLLFVFLLSSRGATAQQDAARPQPVYRDIGAQPGHLPKVHYIPSQAADSKYPFWVDASMVLNADGSLNTDLLAPSAVMTLKALRANAPAQGCLAVGHVFYDRVGVPERSTPEQAVRNSRFVLLGTVTEKTYGLDGDQPGQLLRVTPDEIIKGQPLNVPAYFVFLPAGTFKIGKLEICKTDEFYTDPPTVGEQVLLFVPDSWEWRQNQGDPYLNVLDESGIITIHADATVSMPRPFRTSLKTAPPSSAALLSSMRSVAREGTTSQPSQ